MAMVYGAATGLTLQLAGPFGSVGSAVKVADLTLPAYEWKNAVSPFFQTVTVEGISANSRVDIQLSKEQAAQLFAQGTALHIENDGGTATAWAIGTKPEADLTLQVSVTEVMRA